MSDVKPDLGLSYLKSGIPTGRTFFFNEVSFPHIEIIGIDSYTIMQHIESNGVHAVSYDFGKKQFDEILGQLSSAERDEFISSIQGKRIPFRASLPRTIHAKSIKCHLGELVKVQSEAFAPFVVEEIEF